MGRAWRSLFTIRHNDRHRQKLEPRSYLWRITFVIDATALILHLVGLRRVVQRVAASSLAYPGRPAQQRTPITSGRQRISQVLHPPKMAESPQLCRADRNDVLADGWARLDRARKMQEERHDRARSPNILDSEWCCSICLESDVSQLRQLSCGQPVTPFMPPALTSGLDRRIQPARRAG